MAAKRSDGIYLGTDRADGDHVFLEARRLLQGVQITGPPGVGKTQSVIFPTITQVCERRDGAVFVLAFKGALYPACRNWAINNGHARRLDLFDPGDPEWSTGYDLLKPNGLSVADHARNCREQFREGYLQADFNQTAQLEWLLGAVLYVLREQQLTLDYAGDVIAPKSKLLARLLPKIDDPQVRRLLTHYHGLSASRQEVLGASTFARLQRAVAHPALRAILTQRDHSLDIGRVIREKRICLVNLEEYRPLHLDDLRFLARVLVADIVSHAFGPDGGRHPVYLFLDECQNSVCPTLCTALSQGRELKLATILAHHFLEQLELEDGQEQLLRAVLQCAMTKILFGQGYVPNYDPFMAHFFLDRFNPLAIKHQDQTLESRYVETTRRVRGSTTTQNRSLGLSLPTSQTDGEAEARGLAVTNGTADSFGAGVVNVHGAVAGTTLLPDGQIVTSLQDMSSGGLTDLAGHADIASVTENRTRMKTRTRSRGRTPSIQVGESTSLGESVVPFHEIHQRHVPTGTQFWSLDEHETRCKQLVSGQLPGHFVIKAPGKPAVFVKAPHITLPTIGRQRLARVRERILGQSGYAIRKGAATLPLTPIVLEAEDDDPWSDED